MEHSRDISPQRAILRIRARYKKYRISATELLSPQYRKYNYYLLDVNYVITGFDNAPDTRAIRLKYGEIPTDDKEKMVPHQHLKNKTELVLTSEIQFQDFIEWIKSNLP